MSEQINTILPAFLGLVIFGLWLAYKLGIFKQIKKISDKKEILLPSFFFLTSPFIFSIAFSEAGFGKFREIKSIDTVLTILTTAASIYTDKFLLENYKKKQKKKEIARLLVASLEDIKEVRQGQMQDWLNRAVAEGKVIKTKKPVAYVVNRQATQLSLLSSSEMLS